jgi:hypothetical protein
MVDPSNPPASVFGGFFALREAQTPKHEFFMIAEEYNKSRIILYR